LADAAEYLNNQLSIISDVVDIAPDLTAQIIGAWADYHAKLSDSVNAYFDMDDVINTLIYLRGCDEYRADAFSEVIEDLADSCQML